MTTKIHHVLAFCFSLLLPISGFAEAPVVDESENFMVLDEAQMDEPSAAQRQNNRYSGQNKYDDTEEEMALAEDNGAAPQGNVELLSRLKSMQQEIQELRGQLETQAHDIKLLQQQQLAFYKDIDARLQNQSGSKASAPALKDLETDNSAKAAAIQAQTETQKQIQIQNPMQALRSQESSNHKVAVAPTPVPTVRNTNPADEQISYLAAYDLVKNKRYDEALTSMEEFVTRYPNGGYTANAQYWLGELYMLQKDYSKAIEHFEIVLKNFSTSSKAAASSLKIGYALASSGKKEEARLRLQQVVRNYPDTPTAQLAVTKLMTINAT